MGQVTVVLSGDEARLLRALDRVVQKQKEVGEAGKQVGEQTTQSYTKVENALGRAFGAGAIGSLGLWAVAIKGVQAGLQEVEETFKALEKAQADAAKNVIATGNAQGSLGKYAAGNKATFDALAKAASDTSKESGLSPEAASKLVGEMAEGGYKGGDDNTRRTAWKLKALGEEHAGKSAMQLKRLGSGYLGEAGALSAETRPGEMGELIEGTDETSELAQSVGVSKDELMASIASAGKAANSTKTGASQIKALLGGLKKRNYKGTLEQAVKEFGAIKTSDEHLEKLVGGKEGLEGLRGLQKESGAHLSERLRRDSQGRLHGFGSDDSVLGVMANDPDVKLAQAKARTEAETRAAMERQGRRRAGMDQGDDEAHAKDLTENGGATYGTEYRDRKRRESGQVNEGTRLASSTAFLDMMKEQIEATKETATNTRGKAETLFPGGDGSR